MGDSEHFGEVLGLMLEIAGFNGYSVWDDGTDVHEICVSGEIQVQETEQFQGDVVCVFWQQFR
jgi:hypothetical protein